MTTRPANARLAQIAKSLRVVLPAGPSRAQGSNIARLRGLSAEAFDHSFLRTIGIESHQEAIALFQRQAARGRDQALRTFAGDMLPKLQQHLARAEALHAQAVGPGATRAAGATPQSPRFAEHQRELEQAREQILEAVQVVQRMKSDPELAILLQRAQGVFILPTYGRAALGVGVQGGKGVLVTRRGDEFGNPAFYTMAGASVGAQAGGSAGELAFLLMTERAVQQFRSERKFSLNADAGLTIGNYSARGQASAGKVQDVVVWSGAKGVYAGVSVGLTDVMVDRDANRAYYGRSDATPLQILGGRLENPHPNVLARVLGA